jgi:pSer/pThr/pTyr-binding forkhead associated (FHA) protein
MTDLSNEFFRNACGADEPMRLVVEGPGESRVVELSLPFALIGRDPRADVSCDDARLGKRHAYLQMVAGRWLFVDFLSQTAGHRAGWLDPNQELRFGPLTLRLPEDAAGASWIRSGSASPYRRGELVPMIVNLKSRVANSTWRMKRPVDLIGSSSWCRIRLRDPDVSRFHCALVNTPDGLWAVDLLGRGGILFDGQPVRVAPLGENDSIQIATFTISARRESPIFEGPSTANSQAAPPTATPTSEATTIAQPAVWPLDERSSKDAANSPLIVQLSQLQHQMYLQMQQQLTEQFQHAMSLFVDAFWAMHREQSDMIRKELRRVRRLTQELSQLQTQLEKNSAANAPSLSTQTAMLPAATPPPPASGQRTEPRPPPKADKPAPKPRSAPKPPSASAESPSAKTPAEMHAWLSERVAKIQRERQSSWQKILNLLQGKSAPPAAGTSKPPSET